MLNAKFVLRGHVTQKYRNTKVIAKNQMGSKLFGNFLGGNVKTIKSNNIQSKASNVKCKIRSYKTPKVFQFVMCHTKSSEISISISSSNFLVKNHLDVSWVFS